MAALFEAHVTNLGKYNEGVLAGEPLSFPASPQAVQALLKDISSQNSSAFPSTSFPISPTAIPARACCSMGM